MSYTTIQIDGKAVGLKFGYLSYKSIMTDKNKGLMFDDDGNPNHLGIAKIIYSGYVNNCINKETEAALGFEDISRVVDQIATDEGGVDVLRDIIKCWSDSQDIQNLIKETEEKKSQLAQETTLPASNNSASENLESGPGN